MRRLFEGRFYLREAIALGYTVLGMYEYPYSNVQYSMRAMGPCVLCAFNE